MDDRIPGFRTAEQVAILKGTSLQAVYKAGDRGQLTARFGHHGLPYLYADEEVDLWLPKPYRRIKTDQQSSGDEHLTGD